MNPQHADGKSGNRKKLMIYAGLAGVMLLVFLLTRNSSSSGSSGSSTDAGTTIPATSDDSGGGSDGVDDSSELAGIDTDIQTVGQAVAALQSAQQTAGTTSATGDPDTVSSILTAATGIFQAGAAASGAGAAAPAINVNVTSPKQPGAGNTPVVKPGTKLAGGAIEAPSGGTKPAAKSGYTVVGLGGGRWEYKPVKK